MPKPESRSRASVSSIASFSVVGTTKSLRPGEPDFGAAASKRKTIVVALALGAVAAAGAVTALMLRPAPQPQEVSPVPPTTAPSLGAPGVASVPEADPAPPPATVDLNQLPTEPRPPAAEDDDEQAQAKPHRKRPTTSAAKPKEAGTTATPKAAASAPSKPKTTWKSDPGF